VALLAACETDVPRTVDYYLANAEERSAKVEACGNDVRLAVTPNCVNANEASRRAMLEGRTMPRLRL
jgi:hypothetical protein